VREKVGTIHQGKGLRETLRWIEVLAPPRVMLPSRRSFRAQNMLEVGRLITRCALA